MQTGGSKMKIKSITDDCICFDNGNRLTAYHEQDCCENVYADFEAIKAYNTLGETADKSVFDIDFPEDLLATVELVKDLGFKFNNVFVPCYNEQNGYYNDGLELIYHRKQNGNEVQESLDLTNCTQYKEV